MKKIFFERFADFWQLSRRSAPQAGFSLLGALAASAIGLVVVMGTTQSFVQQKINFLALEKRMARRGVNERHQDGWQMFMGKSWSCINTLKGKKLSGSSTDAKRSFEIAAVKDDAAPPGAVWSFSKNAAGELTNSASKEKLKSLGIDQFLSLKFVYETAKPAEGRIALSSKTVMSGLMKRKNKPVVWNLSGIKVKTLTAAEAAAEGSTEGAGGYVTACMFDADQKICEKGAACAFYENPGGERGGLVDSTATVANTARVHPLAKVFDSAQVLNTAGISNKARISNNAVVKDNAWVFDNAHVYDNAQVSGNARVSGHGRVRGSAKVFDRAHVIGGVVEGRAQIKGEAKVSGVARIAEDAYVYGNAQVSGWAHIRNNAQVSGYAQVSDNAQVSGSAQVSGNARVYEKARVSGNALLAQYARVSGNAAVKDSAKVYDTAWVRLHAKVEDNAKVYGEALVSGNAAVKGSAKVYDSAAVYGNAVISGSAKIGGNAGVFGSAKIAGTARVSGNSKVCSGTHTSGTVANQPSCRTVSTPPASMSPP